MWHQLTVLGNLGRDPELRFTPNGQAVTNLSVAVSDGYTNASGERIDRTIWIRASVWGRQAEAANQYLAKGSRVLLSGTLQGDENGNPRTFERQDGTTSASFEMTANRVVFLSGMAQDRESVGEASEQPTAGEFPF